MVTSAPSTLNVSTRFGTKTFSTCLEWHEAIEELRVLAEGGNNFASSLYEREKANKYLSNSQVSWVYKLAQDALDDRTMSSKVESVNGLKGYDASNILASLAEACAKGIKKPMIRLKHNNGAEIRLKFMNAGKNAGGAWVTMNSDLMGQINDGGVFTWRGRGYSEEVIAEVVELIQTSNENLVQALESYGRLTSKCGCCGLPLTNKKSIELGIGPICLNKYGLLATA